MLAGRSSESVIAQREDCFHCLAVVVLLSNGGERAQVVQLSLYCSTARTRVGRKGDCQDLRESARKGARELRR
eukprot:13169867-Alexandrium_andersonii.AAC.1